MRSEIQKIIAICICWLTITKTLCAEPDKKQEQSAAVFLISSPESTGTGFACLYRGKEFVATNLHVLDGASAITVKSQLGGIVPLSGKMIAGGDADICLLGVQSSFKEMGIKPLEFFESSFKQTKVGDAVVCLGNGLGNGVITETKGRINAYGTPRLEIDCPVVHGNSGGPVIHLDSGKVVGLVTEAENNKLTFDALGVAASKSVDSQVKEISYFAHRIDSVTKWNGTSIADYLKIGQLVTSARTGISRATLFLAAKSGWEEDKRLSEAWKAYEKFMDASAAKTHSTIRVTDTVSVNSYSVTVRRDVRVRSMGVSQADYDNAYEKLKRSVEWKILADQESLKKANVIGYRQVEAQKMVLDFSAQVLALSKEL